MGSREDRPLKLQRCGLFLHAEGNVQAFRTGQSPLNAVGGQERVTFEFERQRDVQQVEAPAAEALGVLFREFSRSLDRGVHVHGDFDQGTAGNEFMKQCQRGIALPLDSRPFGGAQYAALVEGALTNGVGDFQAVEGKKEQRRSPEPPIITNGGRRALHLIRRSVGVPLATPHLLLLRPLLTP